MSEARFIDTDDGVSLAVRVGGRGLPLVLCHGGPGIWDYFDDLRDDLEDLATVISWDQRGCGESRAEGPHTAARYVADLDCIRRALDVETWVVGGHSWGASLALFYALAHPEATRALLYISGTGLGESWNPVYHQEQDRRRRSYQARLDQLSAIQRSEDEEAEWRRLSWRSDLADPERTDLLESMDRPYRVNLEANAALNAERKTWSEEDLAQRCLGLELPVLVVHGREDPRPAWAVDSLVAALPDVDSVILEGVGAPSVAGGPGCLWPSRAHVPPGTGPGLSSMPRTPGWGALELGHGDHGAGGP